MIILLRVLMEYYELAQKQSLPVKQKVILSERAIRDFYEGVDGKVYVAFSGGKDSTVLLHIVRSIYPDVPAVFVDTGLEYPEIREFVKTVSNVTRIKPEMNFKKVLDVHGFPVISKQIAYQIRHLQNPTEKNIATRHFYLTGEKRDGTISNAFLLPKKWHFLINAPFKISEKCCNIMKKEPFRIYHNETKRYPYIGMMASDSQSRQANYMNTGCNSFKRNIQSLPLGFWLEKDVWEYIKTNHLSYASIYDKGISRTGCMFCMFGVHMEGCPNRFQIMEKLHPKQYEYCMKNLELEKVLEYMDIPFKSQPNTDKWIENKK